MSTIATFRDLKETVIKRRENLLAYMPMSNPAESQRIVEAAMTPGTMAHAFMTSLCALIADELAAREHAQRSAK